MDLDAYKNVREPLTTIRDLRESEESKTAGAASDTAAGPIDPYEALRNKFKKL